jgi:signal transduction histidine kinase
VEVQVLAGGAHKRRGLGFGMFQARTIVEAHGGAIQVQSDWSRGTTFRVRLSVQDT